MTDSRSAGSTTGAEAVAEAVAELCADSVPTPTLAGVSATATDPSTTRPTTLLLAPVLRRNALAARAPMSAPSAAQPNCAMAAGRGRAGVGDAATATVAVPFLATRLVERVASSYACAALKPPAAQRRRTSAPSTTVLVQSFFSNASTPFVFVFSSFLFVVLFLSLLSFSSRSFALISTAAENASFFSFFGSSFFAFAGCCDFFVSPVGRVVLILDIKSSSSSSAGFAALPVAGGVSSAVSPSPRVASVDTLGPADAALLPNGSPRLMLKEVFAAPSSSRRESHLDARARIRPPRSCTTLLKSSGISSSPLVLPWFGL
mmetsp:Transcript_7235/g.29940  ORF Transcript_7235/g.29940 Transcript_7235/m.29940 type:complete len:318 (+) Transcript_7235:841-1794(+)